MKSEHKIILLAVSLGLAVWVLDTILDFLFFVKGDFTDLLILNLSVHEIFMRLTVFIVFLVFGILMAKRAIRERELRQDLQKSGEEMAVTLKSIGDAVIATDKNGNIQFMNPVAESLTRWTISEAFGEPIERVFNIVNEQTEEKAPNPIERVLREGKVVGLANHTVLVAKDGKRWPIDDSGAPIKDDRGKVIGAVLVFHDITERRKSEKQINHLNEVLKAIRNVNQLITQVKDRDELLDGVCRELVNTRGFNSACIVLEDGVSRYVASSEIGNSAVEVQKQFQQGYVPSCFKQVREKDDVHVIKEPKEYCRGCPASGMF
ncbi:MAG: PAS domain S-box protein, partial [candidate division Zixibacteria bacterium]|nr:PAS domain S-box protein [candidate division Zixibacteria bacterium]